MNLVLELFTANASKLSLFTTFTAISIILNLNFAIFYIA